MEAPARVYEVGDDFEFFFRGRLVMRNGVGFDCLIGFERFAGEHDMAAVHSVSLGVTGRTGFAGRRDRPARTFPIAAGGFDLSQSAHFGCNSSGQEYSGGSPER